MFNTLLIANRGEIACRIAATARRMGMRTIAVYSDADADARHVTAADVAVNIGGPEPRDSYLRGDHIIEVAKQTGAQAIHPGYGFLAENTEFAQACAAAGIKFIGPSAEAIAAMGSKSAAKDIMEKAGVPLVPGYHGSNQDPDFLQARADEMGYPIMIKASAGGGGRGMRIVDQSADFKEALVSCQREAAAAFGDDTVLLERYLQKPRHIEIQIFADEHGNCVYLFERDCSVQRRHQKVIEEAPAPGMTPERRQAMGEAAVAAARAVNYVGAGTVEFIVEPDGRFYFMEMNTRLQVEHPVTELITGHDLVQWQLEIGAGRKLRYEQDELSFDGHSIEARVYAENPDNDFLPSIGTLSVLKLPEHVEFENGDIRIDRGVQEGDTISPYYDPMIAKVIVRAPDRAQARARMVQVLDQIQSVGVHTNIAFLRRLMLDKSFAEADLDTGLIERQHAELFPPYQPACDTTLALAVATLLIENGATHSQIEQSSQSPDPWDTHDFWRVSHQLKRTYALVEDNEIKQLNLSLEDDQWHISHNEQSYEFDWQLIANNGSTLTTEVQLDDQRHTATTVALEDKIYVFVDGSVYEFGTMVPGLYGEESADGHEGGLTAPMPGKIISIEVAVGDAVKAGDKLLVMEAMKMEHTIYAPANGTVQELFYEVGDQVADGDELIAIDVED